MQPHSQKTKISGTARNYKLMLIIVGLAIVFLGLMIRVGSQKLPVTPTPQAVALPTAMIQPTQPVGSTDQRFYIQVNNADQSQSVVAINNEPKTLFRVAVSAYEHGYHVSNDGLHLYVIQDDGISAYDTTTGTQRWHQASLRQENVIERQLLITPDDSMLVLLSWVRDGDTTQVNIEQLATSDGTIAAPRTVEANASHDFGIDAQKRLWVFGRPQFTIVDLLSNQVISFTDAPQKTFVAGLSRDGTTAYIAAEPGVLGIIDTANQTITTRSLNQQQVYVPEKLIIAPNGKHFVLRGRNLSPMIVDQTLQFIPNQNTLAGDAKTNYVDFQYTLAEYEVGTFANDQLLYITSVTTIRSYDLPSATPTTTRFAIGNAKDLIVAPEVGWYPTNQASATPEPTFGPIRPFDADVTFIPNPPPPVVQNDPRTFAWLWDPNTLDVTAYQRDGTPRTIAKSVKIVLPRHNQMPRFVINTSFHTWVIYDPTAAMTIPIQIENPQYIENSYSYNPNFLSPDQSMIALKTVGDPITTDEFTGTKQLITLNVETGNVTVLGDSNTLPDFAPSNLVLWHDNAIYYALPTFRNDYSNTQAIWRVDVTTHQVTQLPNSMLEQASFAAIVDVLQSEGLILYQRWNPTDPDHAELRLLNVATGDEELIHFGRFVTKNQAVIAPNGKFVAFTIAQSYNSTQLWIFERSTHELRMLADNLGVWQTDPLHWNAESTSVIIPVSAPNQAGYVGGTQDHQYDLAGNLIVNAGRILTQQSNATNRVQIWWDRPRMYPYLQLYEQNASTPRVTFALERRQGDSSIPVIVYVGE